MQNYLHMFFRSYINNFKGLSNEAWEGMFLCLIDSICIGGFYYFSTYFVNELNLSVPEVGAIISFYGIGAIFGSYLCGRFSEKISCSNMLIVCAVLQGLCYLLLPYLHVANFLKVDAFMLGTAAYGFVTANYMNILNHCHDTQQLKALNWLSTVSNFGLGVVVILIGCFSGLNLKLVFYLLAGILFALSFYLLIKQIMFSEQRESISRISIPSKQPTITGTLYFNFFVFSSIFLTGITISQISSTYSLYVQAMFPALGVKAFSILFAINTMFIILFSVQIGTLFASSNKIRVMGLGAFLLGLGIFMLAFNINFAGAVFACIIYTVGEILFFSTAQLLCYQKSSLSARGRGLSVFRTIYAASRAVGPSVGCYLYYEFSPQFLWYVCGLIGLYCFFGANYFRKSYGAST